jgi:hypothetical protein
VSDEGPAQKQQHMHKHTPHPPLKQQSAQQSTNNKNPTPNSKIEKERLNGNHITVSELLLFGKRAIV